jgi:hypothetical protein
MIGMTSEDREADGAVRDLRPATLGKMTVRTPENLDCIGFSAEIRRLGLGGGAGRHAGRTEQTGRREKPKGMEESSRAAIGGMSNVRQLPHDKAEEPRTGETLADWQEASATNPGCLCDNLSYDCGVIGWRKTPPFQWRGY